MKIKNGRIIEMKKGIIGVAFMVFLGGCVSKRQYVRDMAEAEVLARANCAKQVAQAHSDSYYEGQSLGRQEMLKLLYRKIADASPQEIFDFVVDVRTAEHITTTDKEFKDWSKESKSRIAQPK
jgi:hypothetical protein